MEKMPSFGFPEKKKPAESNAGKWLKRSVALAGAAAVGYFGGLKKEKGAEEVPPPAKPKIVEVTPSVQERQASVNADAVKTRVLMRLVKIADGIEQEHAVEVDEKGNAVRDLGAYHLWKEAHSSSEKGTSSFQGYGIETKQKSGEVVVTPYGSKEGNKTSFSGYGISTETEDGKVTKSPYGESKDGKKKFRGYGIER